MKSLYERFDKSKGICTDSRKLRSGQIFFALKGDNFNGNQFANEALKNGASAIVLDEIIENLDYNNSDVFFVKNVLAHLQNFATYHRNKWGKTIIGITGSNGKTTVKELLFNVLSQGYSTHATEGNYNNHIGVPLTLLNIRDSHDIAIVEMGANHIGEIKALCEISLPDYGYITNFGLAHLEGFGGIEGVIKGKSELYEHLDKNNSISFVNPNDSIALKNCNSQNIEFTDGVTFFYKSGLLGVSFGNEEILTNLTGSYQENNVLAAITIGRNFELEDSKIAKGIANYIPQNNRGQIFKTGKNTIFLDAYNANPTSMEASLRNAVNLYKKMPHVYIAGGLLELGEYSKSQHQRMIEIFQELEIENAWFIGKQFEESQMPEKYYNYRDTAQALEALRGKQIHGNFIWIKGSRSFALEALLDEL
jgi:UDP-N-acetylmuramoyl-tripeptide--D-alanyl-D-alanine ligase